MPKDVTKWGTCYYKVRQGLLQRGTGNLLQSGESYYKGGMFYLAGQLLKRMAVHLRDTWTNRDPCLSIGPTQFESRVVKYNVMAFRRFNLFTRYIKTHISVRAHRIFHSFDLTGYTAFTIALNI